MILFEYIYWHYSLAPRKIWEIAANYARAAWHKFLIVQHLSTLFSPWHRRLPSDFGKPRDAGDKIIDLISDFYIRIVAACIRLTIVFTGLIYIAFTVVFFTLGFFIWVLWPFIAVGLIGRGLILIGNVF